MAVTVTLPAPSDEFLPAWCGHGACVCFEDAAYTVAGTGASITLTLAGLPTDGQDFFFAGKTWVYKTTPTGDWDIQIGGTINATATNTAAAFYRYTDIDNVTWAAFAITSNIVVSAIKHDAGLGFSLLPITAPISATAFTAGVSPSVASPYELLMRLRTRSTSDSTDYASTPDIIVRPVLTASPLDGELTAEMCVPVQAFIQSKLNTPFPALQGGAGFTSIHSASVEVEVRWSLNDGAWTTSDPFHFLPARCIDTEAGYGPYFHTPGGGRSAKWLNHVVGGTWCTGSMPVFYAWINEEEYELTITDNTPTTTTIPASYKPRVLEVNILNLITPGYSGIVTVHLERVSDNQEHEEFDLTINGACGCRTQLLFLNDFGAYEAMECGPLVIQGLTVSANEFVGCDTCTEAGGRREMRNTFSRRMTLYTDKEELTTDRRARINSLLTSPEVWYREFDGNTLMSTRAFISKGDVTVQPSVRPWVQVALEIALPEETTNSNT